MAANTLPTTCPECGAKYPSTAHMYGHTVGAPTPKATSTVSARKPESKWSQGICSSCNDTVEVMRTRRGNLMCQECLDSIFGGR